MSTPSSSDADDASVGADTNNPSTGNEPRTGTTPTSAAGHTPQDQHQHATASGDEDSTAGTATKSDASAKEVDSKTAEDGTSDASAGTSGKTQVPVDLPVDKVIRIMGFRQETQDYLNKQCPTKEKLEEFLELSSEKIRAINIKKEDVVMASPIGGEADENVLARFNQADRAKLILLGRWTENNLIGNGHEIQWGHFNKKSFNEFGRKKVDVIILDEILDELKLSKEVKETLKDNVHTPASFAGKSKYWYEKVIKLSSTDVDEIEKFNNWYKYQLDTYLPSDWIHSFRVDSTKEKKIEWRKVLKAIGMDDDAIQALEINKICDFGTLNHRSEKWRIAEPTSKKDGDDVSNIDWNEWKSLGLNMNDARNIINFRHWHNFYVAKKDDKSDWATEFKSAHYERFVQRYVDPSKPDDYKPPNLWESWLKPSWWEVPKKDNFNLNKEKQDYYEILHRAVEDGSLTEEQRYRLRQHFSGRREKMNLIQELNEGVGDTSFLEKRLTEICEEEAKKDKTKKSEYLMFIQDYCQFVFSALIVYALLAFWVGTTFVLMLTHPIFDEEEDTYLVFVHNITFGLVTAVVIQELGEERKKTSLYNRFLPVYNERLQRYKETRFQNQLKLRRTSCSMWNVFEKIHAVGVWVWEVGKYFCTLLILMSTRIFILGWIIFGTATLTFGIVRKLDPQDLLYTTGQTWLGIAVSIGYSYFGLNGKNAPNLQEAKDTVDKSIKDAVQSAIGGGDGGSGGDEAKFTNERGETKDINTRHELMKELESQLAEAEERMGAAIEKGNIDGADKFLKKVIKLKRKLKEETKKEKEEALDGGDASGNKDIEEVAKECNDNEDNKEE